MIIDKLIKKTTERCPKCGSNNIDIRSVGDWKQYFACFCGDCGYTPVKFDEARITPKGAIKIWNKRCKDVR